MADNDRRWTPGSALQRLRDHAPRINFDDLSVVGRRLYNGRDGSALADFSSHSAACQVAHLLNDPEWTPPYGRWFTTLDDVARMRAVREMIDEA